MTQSKAAEGAVFASAQIVGFFASIPDGLFSLAVGLLGVALARWVFVNRENRRLQRRERWHETLPLTLVAMLVATVIVHDRRLGLSAAAFVGLGVGWAAVLLLDVLGERVMAMLRAGLGSGPTPPMPPMADLSGHDGRITSAEVDIPHEIAKLIDEADKIDSRRRDK